MEEMNVTMVHDNLQAAPFYPLPPGISVRTYQPGDEAHWADIEVAVGEFAAHEDARECFRKEFLSDPAAARQRCFFLYEGSQQAVGIISAWYNQDFQGEPYGRIHWVALHPDVQGKGLGKPLMSVAMEKLKEDYRKAYLVTQTTKPVAVNLYLGFGFVPDVTDEASRRGWSLLARTLSHPQLAPFLVEDPRREQVTSLMTDYFGADQERIAHALQVTAFAEKLFLKCHGQLINRDVVLYAALLHDIGIPLAETKHGSSRAEFQELEGPPIAQQLLASIGVTAATRNEVAEIIAHHHSPGKVKTAEFALVYDADWLVNFPGVYGEDDAPAVQAAIDKVFLTEQAKAMAVSLYGS